MQQRRCLTRNQLRRNVINQILREAKLRDHRCRSDVLQREDFAGSRHVRRDDDHRGRAALAKPLHTVADFIVDKGRCQNVNVRRLGIRYRQAEGASNAFETLPDRSVRRPHRRGQSASELFDVGQTASGQRPECFISGSRRRERLLTGRQLFQFKSNSRRSVTGRHTPR